MRKINAAFAAVTLIFVALILGACSANQYSGINYSEADFVNDGQIKNIKFYGGKESGKVKLTVKLPNGAEATFEGEDVKAFDGQAVRAEVEKAQIEIVGKIVPDLTDAILQAIVPLL